MAKDGEYVIVQGVRYRRTPHGLLFSPERSGEKKHPCPDCLSCGTCSESRCRVCRGEKGEDSKANRQP